MSFAKIAACVTLFHPSIASAKNIKSYIAAVDHLYLIDNGGGEAVIAELTEYQRLGLVTVLTYKDNAGIARPLNDVLALCHDSYDFLLTMDQDSYFAPSSLELFLRELASFDWDLTLGLGANYTSNDASPYSEDVTQELVYRVITSGNIINVKNALAIGGFNEKLFIDEVDHEFCLRGRAQGFLSYRCGGGIKFYHQLGTAEVINTIFGSVTLLGVHNYIRSYYIYRNQLYVLLHYFTLAPIYMLRCYVYSPLRYLMRMVLLERDRKRKLKAVIAGLADAFMGRMGKKDFKGDT